jgi:two-component system, OmpR family, sensor histidine kinase ArlS
MNIRRKLALQFSLIATSLFIILSLSVYYASSSHRQNDFHSRLKDRALTTARLFVTVHEIDSLLLRLIDKNSMLLYKESIRIFNYDQTEIYCSTDRVYTTISGDIFNEIRQHDEWGFFINGRDVCGITFQDSGKKFIIIASAEDIYGFRNLNFLKIILFTGILASALISILLGLFLAGRALKPISMIIDQAKKISAQRLDLRLKTGNNKDELAQLSVAFNEMLERLDKSNELQKTFIYNVSHGLRTPYSLILAEIEISLMKERSVKDYIKTLRSISDEVKKINALSDGLLELIQVSLDVPLYKFEPLRVDELLLQSGADLTKQEPEYKVNIDEINLPEEEEMVTGMGNEALLKKAFINLMSNACKFSNDKNVFLKLYTSERYVFVEFIDKGIGIPDDEIDRIFDPFFRCSNFTGKHGHGLGLTLAKRIIELHKGTIQATSVLNHGSTFVVKLPIMPRAPI